MPYVRPSSTAWRGNHPSTQMMTVKYRQAYESISSVDLILPHQALPCTCTHRPSWQHMRSRYTRTSTCPTPNSSAVSNTSI
eukprot:10493-Eustigmatos_ZCMA.PRE.1